METVVEGGYSLSFFGRGIIDNAHLGTFSVLSYNWFMRNVELFPFRLIGGFLYHSTSDLLLYNLVVLLVLDVRFNFLN